MAIKAYYIPNGPENLTSVFPMVDFNQVAEYYLELVDSMDNVIATTPINDVKGCEDDDDKIRVHFLNSLGAIDAANFKRTAKLHENKSEAFQTPLRHPLDKTKHFNNRFNVSANDTYSLVTIDYKEEHLEWLNELADSPLAWIQWPSAQGQPENFMPIVISDGKGDMVKQDERWLYQYTIEFKPSNDKFIIRN